MSLKVAILFAIITHAFSRTFELGDQAQTVNLQSLERFLEKLLHKPSTRPLYKYNEHHLHGHQHYHDDDDDHHHHGCYGCHPHPLKVNMKTFNLESAVANKDAEQSLEDVTAVSRKSREELQELDQLRNADVTCDTRGAEHHLRCTGIKCGKQKRKITGIKVNGKIKCSGEDCVYKLCKNMLRVLNKVFKKINEVSIVKYLDTHFPDEENNEKLSAAYNLCRLMNPNFQVSKSYDVQDAVALDYLFGEDDFE